MLSSRAAGQARPDAEIPVDVHYAKLASWLVDRKKAPADWRKRLAALHARVGELARKLPARLARARGPGVPDVALLSADGDPPAWDYFRAVVVRDRILDGGADAEEPGSSEPSAEESDATDPSAEESAPGALKPRRGFFGGLTGVAKAWDDVVRAYERDGLHLPEAALAMARAVDHDIPYHRAQVAKRGKQLVDLDRREAEYKRQAAAAAKKFEAMRADVFGADFIAEKKSRGGDAAKAIEADVAALARKTDAVFERVADAARADEVGEAAEHYAEWIAWAHGGSATAEELLPALARLRAFEAGATVAPPERSRSEDERRRDEANDEGGDPGGVVVEPPAGGIDWGVSVEVDEGDPGAATVVEPPAGGIDWGVSVEDDGGDPGAAAVVEPPAGGIDWGVSVEDDGGDPGAAAVVEPPAGGIDWGVSVEDDGGGGGAPSAGGIDWDVGDFVVEATASGETSSAPLAPPTPGPSEESESDPPPLPPASELPFHLALRDQAFRASVADDLCELRAFLRQRAVDLRGREAATLLASAPASVRSNHATPDALDALAAACEAPVAILAAPANRRLLLVAASARFRSRLAAEVVVAGEAEGKLLRAAEELDARRAETKLAHRRGAAKAESMRVALGEVKAAVEAAVSKMLGGRVVNVVGDVNKVLDDK